MALSFDWPIPPGSAAAPIWTGDGFRIGDRTERVLAFPTGESGWHDGLTDLHEETAGGDHFIDIASRRHTLAELRRELTGPRPTVLEVGCSGGHFLRDLIAAMPEAEIIGADFTRGALEQLGRRLPTVPLLQFDLTRCPLPNSSVDAVVLLNVLEHIERDDLAVAQAHRVLRPGGVLVAEVPAGPGLYDGYNSFLMHFRRYDMAGLVRLITVCGFTVDSRSHLGFVLYPAFWLSKKLNRRRGTGGELDHRRLVERSIASTKKAGGPATAVMRLEDWLRCRVYLPVGIRCLITCRKI